MPKQKVSGTKYFSRDWLPSPLAGEGTRFFDVMHRAQFIAWCFIAGRQQQDMVEEGKGS